MLEITVKNTKLHESINAFKVLFDREPIIYTCSTFVDSENVCVFKACLVTCVGRTLIQYEADGDVYKARINDVEHFTLS